MITPRFNAFAKRKAAVIGCIAFALLFAGCAQIVSVKETRPSLAVQGSPNLQAITRAAALSRNAPLAALGGYLSATRNAYNLLGHTPEDPNALAEYNFAVARCIDLIQRADLEPWGRQLEVPGVDGGYLLTARVQNQPRRSPFNYQLIPADTLSIGGSFFSIRAQVKGIGAPLVAIERDETSDYRKTFQLKKVYAATTAIIQFSGRHAELELLQPLQTEKITLNGHTYPVAADFSAPMAMLMARERPQKLGFIRLLRPDRYRDTALLSRLQPYDKNRTPIIFIHGLQDTAATWAPMIAP